MSELRLCAFARNYFLPLREPKTREMKNEQQQQARHLFLQTDLTKTQIANLLDVDRRTIYQWSIDGSWERLKMAAANIPSLLVEKCYYLFGHFADHLLSRPETNGAITRSEVESLYKLTLSIGKLKKGSTLNENMEAFTWFVESMKRKNPALAQQVLPYMDDYINARKGFSETHFLPEGYTEDGYKRPRKLTPAQEAEQKADAQDLEALLRHLKAIKKEDHQPVPQPAPPQPETGAIDLEALMKEVNGITKTDPEPTRDEQTPGDTRPTGAEALAIMNALMDDLETQYPHLRNPNVRPKTNQYTPRAA